MNSCGTPTVRSIVVASRSPILSSSLSPRCTTRTGRGELQPPRTPHGKIIERSPAAEKYLRREAPCLLHATSPPRMRAGSRETARAPPRHLVLRSRRLEAGGGSRIRGGLRRALQSGEPLPRGGQRHEERLAHLAARRRRYASSISESTSHASRITRGSRPCRGTLRYSSAEVVEKRAARRAACSQARLDAGAACISGWWVTAPEGEVERSIVEKTLSPHVELTGMLDHGAYALELSVHT